MKNGSYYKSFLSKDSKRTLLVGLAFFMASAMPPIQTMAADTYSISQTVTVEANRIALTQLFSQIEKQSEFLFFYVDADVQNVFVKVQARNKSINDVLSQALKGTGLAYTINNRNVNIHKTNANVSEKQQQARKITGMVKDANGEPVIGANISEAGTTNGTISDVEGKFLLNMKGAATIKVSCMGYVTQTISVAGKNNIVVTLAESSQTLDEVVVVGFGTQKKVNLTGSVASVDSKLLENRPMTNVSAGLSGLLPGVYVRQQTGLPGGDDASIKVRGIGTLNNASPMVIVDGVESSMSQISASDIASISVLKDAASAAIYGSKAANGVILITTKAGESGKTVVNYSGDMGWQTATRLPEYLGSADYATLYNEALVNSGKSKKFTDEDIALFRNGTDPYGHPDTDWQNLLYSGSGLQTTHNLSFSGGTEKTTYRTSLNYQQQDGIIKYTGKKQYSARTNITMNPTKWITSNLNLSYTRINRSEPNNAYVGGGLDQVIRQVNRIAPWIPYKNEDGTYGTISDGNPIAWIDQGTQIHEKKEYFLGIGSLQLNLMKDLNVKGTFSWYSYNNDKNEKRNEIQYNANKYQGPTQMTQSNSGTEKGTADIVANYSKKIDSHSFAVMAGYHAETYDYKTTSAYRKDFPSIELGDLDGGATAGMTNSGYTRELNMQSWFGRVNYDFNGKYLLEGNIRYDASSRFAEGNRWGAFPSLSAGWRISEESFFENLKPVINNLKVRASWGQLGNQDALSDYYPTVPTLSLGQDYPLGETINSGAAIVYAKNAALQWEKTTSYGLGLDFSLFSKLDVTVDFYNRKTSGIIMVVPSPETYPLKNFYDNVGKMSNKGVELNFNYNDKVGDLKYGVGGNLAYNKNELLQLANTNQIISGRYLRRVGEALDVFYGYKTDGLYQSQDDIKNWAKNTLFTSSLIQPGDLRYVDTTGDKSVDSSDRTILGKSTPDFIYGFNLHAEYKNFDIMAMFQGALGGYGYMEGDAIGATNGDSQKPAAIWMDRWTPTHTNTDVPRLIANINGPSMPQTNTLQYWLRSTNYLRLKNLQVGYNVPQNIISKLGVTKARIYYSAQNLLTLTHFSKGWDPEAPSGRGSSYPVVMVNSFGINLTF